LKVEENDSKNKIHSKIMHKQGCDYKINAMKIVNETNKDYEFSVKKEDSNYKETLIFPNSAMCRFVIMLIMKYGFIEMIKIKVDNYSD